MRYRRLKCCQVWLGFFFYLKLGFSKNTLPLLTHLAAVEENRSNSFPPTTVFYTSLLGCCKLFIISSQSFYSHIPTGRSCRNM